MKRLILILLITQLLIQNTLGIPLETLYPDQKLDGETKQLETCYLNQIQVAGRFLQELNKKEYSHSQISEIQNIYETLLPLERNLQVVIRRTTKRITLPDPIPLQIKIDHINYLTEKHRLYRQAFLGVQTLNFRISDYEKKLKKELQMVSNKIFLDGEQDNMIDNNENGIDLSNIEKTLEKVLKLKTYIERIERLLVRVIKKLEKQIIQYSLKFLKIEQLAVQLNSGERPLPQTNEYQDIEQCAYQFLNGLAGSVTALQSIIQGDDYEGKLNSVLKNTQNSHLMLQRAIKNLSLRIKKDGALHGAENPVKYYSQALYQLDKYNLLINFISLKLDQHQYIIQQIFSKIVQLFDQISQQQQQNSDLSGNWFSGLLDGENPFESSQEWIEKLKIVQNIGSSMQEISDQLQRTQNNLERSEHQFIQRITSQMLDGLTIARNIEGKICISPDFCLTEEKFEKCQGILENLDGESTNNSSISNTCTPKTLEGKQIFEFKITYSEPFKFDGECLTQVITFQGIELEEGQNSLNEWQFDPVEQILVFSISHKDFDTYNCQFTEDENQFVWQCDMQLQIFFGPYEQLMFMFKIQVVLSRIKENELTVNVVKNQVEGFCCENQLNIQTTVNFCSDSSCTEYLDSPLQIKRGEQFIVEHSILTPEFQHYFLEGIMIKLGQFLPTIIQTDGSQPGKFIYVVKSNIAGSDLLVEVISRIHKTDPNARRRMRILLSEEQKEQILEQNYKVNSYAQMSIEPEISPNNNKGLDSEQEEKSFIMQIFESELVYIIGGSLIFVLFSTVLAFRCAVAKRGRKNQKSKTEIKGPGENEEMEGQCRQEYSQDESKDKIKIEM